MNILTVNCTASKGGAAAIANVIHQGVNRIEGVTSVFISGRDSDDHAKNVVSLGISSVRFLTNVFFYRMFGLEGVLNQNAWRHIFSRYYSWADVVHLHNVHGYYLPFNVLVKLLKKPVVWTLHDSWLGTGGCAVPGDCDGTERKCLPCPYPHRYPSALIGRNSSDKACKEALVGQSSAQFVAPSHTFRDELIRMGIPESRLHVIENPLVDFPNDISKLGLEEARELLELPLDRRIITFIANRVDEPAKGFTVLIEALSQLPRQENWYLVVIGQVSNKLKQEVLSQPVEVCFTGPLEERRTLFKYLVASNCFVNPSYSETFGLVNIEACAAGCRVVCSDIPVFREFDLGIQLFFDPGDSQGLAQVLIDMCENKAEPNGSRLLRTKSVCERFSLERACSRYTDVYNEVLDHRFTYAVKDYLH